MNRSSFLKFLLAPLLAPLVKFLPKREEPISPTTGLAGMPTGVQIETYGGVVSGTAGHGLQEGDLLRVDATGIVYRMERSGQHLIGQALENAPAGGSVLVRLMGP